MVNFSFFQADFPAMGTSPKEGLFVQCTNGEQHFPSCSRGNQVERQYLEEGTAEMMLCIQAVRSLEEKLL